MANELNVPPPTFEDPFVDDNGRLSSEAFNYFVTTLLPRIGQTASIFGGTTPSFDEETNAAIAPTAFPLGALSTGLYRVMVFLRVTTGDGVSSSVAPVLGFVSDGVTCTMTGDALTSDAIDEPISQAFLVNVDQPGPIAIATLYASNTPNAMFYRLIATVERVQ